VAGESAKSNSVKPCTRTSNGLMFLPRASPFDSPHYVTKSFPSKPAFDIFISDTSYINTYRIPTPINSPKPIVPIVNNTYRPPRISTTSQAQLYQSDRTGHLVKQYHNETEASDTEIVNINLATKKKYKPVALKVKPHIGTLPDKFRIIRNIIGDPLKDLPILPVVPPTFTPTGRYTEERKEIFDKLNAGFLLLSERDLLHYFMMVHNDGFAWETSERGHFREDFFPPVDIPVIPHKEGFTLPPLFLWDSDGLRWTPPESSGVRWESCRLKLVERQT
jgi:hypothetical protein